MGNGATPGGQANPWIFGWRCHLACDYNTRSTRTISLCDWCSYYPGAGFYIFGLSDLRISHWKRPTKHCSSGADRCRSCKWHCSSPRSRWRSRPREIKLGRKWACSSYDRQRRQKNCQPSTRCSWLYWRSIESSCNHFGSKQNRRSLSWVSAWVCADTQRDTCACYTSISTAVDGLDRWSIWLTRGQPKRATQWASSARPAASYQKEQNWYLEPTTQRFHAP